jgi:hypothetical protein
LWGHCKSSAGPLLNLQLLPRIKQFDGTTLRVYPDVAGSWCWEGTA